MTPGGSAVATIKGVVPAQERTVTDLASQVEEGQLDALGDVAEGSLPPVLLGRDLASTLGVGVGDVVSVTSPNGRLSPYGMVPSIKKFRVAGTVHSGLYEFDAQWAYIPLSVAQRLFTEGSDSASLVEVRIDDIYAVKEVAPRLVAAVGEGHLTTDWIMMNQSLFSALWLEKVAIGITIGLIVMVAALNIVATLILLVMEKHKDIAILVSMGASRGAITRIFMLQGTVIGAMGTLTGSVLGWALCRFLDHYKLIRVPVDVYQISYVPFTLLPLDAATVIVGAVLICFLATIHPARGASRLDPAEALRYE
jgi:lipoprotein-releasing system permease protein